jgi:hypothetical protein
MAILGVQQWHDEIGRALARCNWFLLLLTPAAVKSMWVKRELLYALDNCRYQGKIVPLLCRKCDCSQLSWTLPAFQQVDLTANFDTGCRNLLRIWGLDYTPNITINRNLTSRRLGRVDLKLEFSLENNSSRKLLSERDRNVRGITLLRNDLFEKPRDGETVRLSQRVK